MSLRRVERIRAKSDLFEHREYRPADVLHAAQVDFVDLVAMLLTNRRWLLDAASALDEAHERLCGCDDPGNPSCVAGREYEALVPLLVDG